LSARLVAGRPPASKSAVSQAAQRGCGERKFMDHLAVKERLVAI
jgi:hypothetical protein